MKNNKKVGIACGCRKLNYGSILQSYALCEAIKSMGYDCEFVWLKGSLFKHYNIRIGKIFGVAWNAAKHPTIIPKVGKSIRRVSSKDSSYSISNDNRVKFEEFNQNYISIKYYTWSELKEAAKNCYSKFVCGSDQIWNSYEYYLDPMYFLTFAQHEKRIAFAPSFGTDTISYYNYKIIKKYIRGFRNISVREETGKKICSDLGRADAVVVADPTFLLDKDEWKNKLKLKERNEEYCLVYFLSYPNDDAIKLIDQLRSEISIKAVPLNFDCYKKNEIISAGPKEFLELLMNAKYIVTDSFHGTILSINFGKQFLCFERQYASNIKQSSRIIDVLKRFNLAERYNVNQDNALNILKEEIPYFTISKNLNDFRKMSYDYLENALRT